MAASPSVGGSSRSGGAIARPRRSFVFSVWAEFLGLLLFVAICNLFPNLGGNLNDGGLIVLGLILSLVPASLWLVVFYRADRMEPEPRQYVVAVFIGALVIMAALHQPLFAYLYAVDSWLYTYWWAQLLGGILVIGFASMGIVYLTVRALIFDNPEFDERTDGIVYAIAAGLGVATVNNIVYVVQHGGVELDIGSIRMVTTALGYASFAGVLGYFMGQSRFEKTPAYYLPLGITIAALLTGFYFFALDRAGAGQLTDESWRDLLLGGFLALVTMGAVGWLMRRSNEETLRVAQLNAAGDAWEPRSDSEAAADGGKEAA